MVVDTLGGAFCGPHPLSLACKVAGRPENGLAVLISCTVHSGLSLSISSGFGFLFVARDQFTGLFKQTRHGVLVIYHDFLPFALSRFKANRPAGPVQQA